MKERPTAELRVILPPPPRRPSNPSIPQAPRLPVLVATLRARALPPGAWYPSDEATTTVRPKTR